MTRPRAGGNNSPALTGRGVDELFTSPGPDGPGVGRTARPDGRAITWKRGGGPASRVCEGSPEGDGGPLWLKVP